MNLLREAIKAALENRPTRTILGNEISIHVSKLIFTSLFDLGTAGEGFLFHGGRHLGEALVEMGVVEGDDIETILKELIGILNKLKLGIFSLLKADIDSAVIQQRDCYFCTGLPNVGREICYYESGILSGALNKALNRKFEVNQTKCHSMGDELCEFEIRRV